MSNDRADFAKRAERTYECIVTAAWFAPIAWLLLQVAFPPIVSIAWLVLVLGASVVMGWWAFLMPAWYWQIRAGLRCLGVRTFGRFVVHGPLWNRWIASRGVFVPILTRT